MKHKDAHPRYKGFEVLLDTHDDASLPRIYGSAWHPLEYTTSISPPPISFPLPLHTDTKSCSQALRYALKHPLMLPGSTPMSRPPTTGHYLLRKSSAQQTGPHTRSKVRELRQVLHDMRERSSLMEASLGKFSTTAVHTYICANTLAFIFKSVHSASSKWKTPQWQCHIRAEGG